MPFALDHRPRHLPGTRGWYEVWYFVVWDPPGRNAFWIRYTALSPLDSKGAGECALWFVRYSADHPERNLALKRTLPLDQLASESARWLRLRIGDATLDEGGARGGIAAGEHEVSWDLKWFSGGEPYRPVPAALRGRAKSEVVVPHWNAQASGEVRVDGNVFTLARGPATQAHIFGTRYSPGWQWGHGAGFAEKPELVCEGLSGRVKVLGLTSPALTSFGCAGIGARHEPRSLGDMVCNRAVLEGSLPAGPWSGVNTLGAQAAARRPDPGARLRWTLTSRGSWADYRWEVSARALDLAVVEYLGPVGERLNCYNTAVADSRLVIAPRDGAAERVFASQASTAFEVVVPVR